MNKVNISLRLKGELPPDEEIKEQLGLEPTEIFRKGDLLGLKRRRVQSIDVWILDLTPKLDYESSEEEIKYSFHEASKVINRVAKSLSSWRKDNFIVELLISTIQREDQGGFCLPVELVQAVASADLPIEVMFLYV